MSNPVYMRAEEVQHADIGEELVALDAQTGDCFGFNQVAATVWRHLGTPKSLDELRAALMDEYEVSEMQCSKDLEALLDELVGTGLLRREP